MSKKIIEYDPYLVSPAKYASKEGITLILRNKHNGYEYVSHLYSSKYKNISIQTSLKPGTQYSKLIIMGDTTDTSFWPPGDALVLIPVIPNISKDIPEFKKVIKKCFICNKNYKAVYTFQCDCDVCYCNTCSYNFKSDKECKGCGLFYGTRRRSLPGYNNKKILFLTDDEKCLYEEITENYNVVQINPIWEHIAFYKVKHLLPNAEIVY